MAKKKSTKEKSDSAEVLRDILIVQIGMADVPQNVIRNIVGCDMNRVTRIVKHLKTSRKQTKERS